MNIENSLQADGLYYWNHLAVPCGKVYGELGDYLHRYVINPALEKTLGDVKGRSVLDLGSGVGNVARMLSARGAKVVAIDFSSQMLTVSKSRNKGVQHVQADLTKPLPFLSKTFDNVLEVMVLHTVEDEPLKYSISEVNRILKKGGSCAIVIPHPGRAEQFRGLLDYNPRLYLSTQRLMYEWKDLSKNGNHESIITPFILRSPQFYIQAFLDRGFILQEFTEPSIINEARVNLDEVHDIDTFDKLIEKPSFILLKWLKL